MKQNSSSGLTYHDLQSCYQKRMSFATFLLDFSKTSLIWQTNKVLFKRFSFRYRSIFTVTDVYIVSFRYRSFFFFKDLPFSFLGTEVAKICSKVGFCFFFSLQKAFSFRYRRLFYLSSNFFSFRYINVFQKCFLLGTEVFFRSHLS